MNERQSVLFGSGFGPAQQLFDFFIGKLGDLCQSSFKIKVLAPHLNFGRSLNLLCAFKLIDSGCKADSVADSKNNTRIEISTWKISRTREINCRARREWPPSSKKLSCRPICSTFNTSLQI